ncbi:LysE family translocator [Bacillus sp. Marseille-P3800]|uniref:LysE family translocator n=1 Tax=Bacillus sp. Marseille-P3800 TaxID=2014782 RepID=UPI000C077703|nr:LysE family translocator [Bacillus sp. Marseille-P3800]
MLEFHSSVVNHINWTSFFIASVLLASIPGANQVLSLRNGLQHGIKKAIHGMVGRFSAFAIMIIAVSIGVGLFISTSPYVLTFIKWAGVLYLSWIGVRTLIREKHSEAKEGEEKEEVNKTSFRLCKEEFTVACLNPQAYLLFAVFLPQFIQTTQEGIGINIIVIGLIYIGIEFFFACLYAFSGDKLKKSKITPKIKNNLDRVTGLAMIILAVFLSTQNFG